jgi:hypothetical protein
VFCKGYVEKEGLKLAPHTGHVSNFCGLKRSPFEPIQLPSGPWCTTETGALIQIGHANWTHLELPYFCGEAGVGSQEATRESDTECGIVVIVAGGKGLQKMRKNPMGWRIEELQAVAEENFVEWRRPGRGGSHVIFSALGVREIVSVPSKRPIKPVYVKQFLKLIDAAGGIRAK